MQRILILGATSSIARALATEFARHGASLFLAARDLEEVQRTAQDLQIRFQVPVHAGVFEAEDLASHPGLLETVRQDLGEVDGVVFAVGMLGSQPGDSHEPEKAVHLVEVNLTAAVSVLSRLANQMEASGRGFIAGISSVAGDRGRQSNYVYGAAKGGLSLFLQGLRNRLEKRHVKVFTIKPGFVDTAMTYGAKGLFLVASPEAVARSIHRIINRKPSGVYYLPWFWRAIMLVIRLIPEGIFKKLSL